MDDGSREGQSCPPIPRDYRFVPATNVQSGGRGNLTENLNIVSRSQDTSGGVQGTSGSTQDASRPSTSRIERPRSSRSRSPVDRKPKYSRTEGPEDKSNVNKQPGQDSSVPQPPTSANSASAAMAAVAGAIERQQKLQAGGHDSFVAAQLSSQLAAGQATSVADVTNLSASDVFLRQQFLASSSGVGAAQEAAKTSGQGGSDSRMQPPSQSAIGGNRPGTGAGARFSSQTPAPNSTAANQSSVAMHATAALHPTLGAIGMPQQEQNRQQQFQQQTAKLHSMARTILPNNMPANSMTPEGANVMNLLYQQHQQAQQQQKNQQQQEAEAVRQFQLLEKEIQKKNEMAMRQKEEEAQRARHQAQQRGQLSSAQQQRPGPSNQQPLQAQLAQQQQQQQLQLQQQQFLAALAGMPMQGAASGARGQPLVPPNYLQNLPAATQFMLQQMMPGQQPGTSTAAQTSGLPANFLEALVAQSAAEQGQQAVQASVAQSQATNMALQQQQAAMRQAQQRLNQPTSAPNFSANFPPPAAAQPSLTHGTAGSTANNAARPGTVDQNQLYALSLLQNQAHALDAHARETTASVQAGQNPFGQLNANMMNYTEAFRQLQQNVLERTMNPALYTQLLHAQQQHQQQQQNQQLQMQLVQQLQQQQMQQRGIAPINPNQLASLVGGMPSMMEAELLVRQMSGQQLPPNLQRTAQDREHIVEQHRLFQQQLMAAANTAGEVSAASAALPPGLYNTNAAQLAAQLRNGAAGAMGNVPQKK